ncbi:MAG: acylneuraminate cytidylyltransferase family protein [Bacteroidales bacterium]|nr:acylneuraminate cytidylyltransferase family protein [Bacteroidales bacterium]MCD8395130.1 acylneuraminate cytidylyltransferase family protein [Bacteroidales bacterium]
MKRGNILVVIPARGGSKGIPRKNIKPFLGTPLLHYAINVGRAVADDSHVILSTDDEEIAKVARQTGLKVPYMRPAELATDHASSRDAILDVMDWAHRQGLQYDRVLLLQPTSPLRTVEDVERTLAAYSPDIDMAVTVKEASCNPYYNCYETDADGFITISKGDGLLTRRQDAPHAWEINGAVYVINPQSLREREMGKFRRRVPVEMDAQRSVDLDTPLDWEIAEAIGRHLNQ